MSDPFIGEIRAVAFSYAPEGWALCNGQLLQVSQYQALFALLSTNFGGNGSSTFGVPNLQGRAIVHAGIAANIPPVDFAQVWGASSVALTFDELPTHTHVALASDPGHSHGITVPAHTHSFALPCSDGTGAGAATKPSPVNAYLAPSTGVDAGINTAINDANAIAGQIASDYVIPGAPFPSVANTPLYAANPTTGVSMGGGTTGNPSGTPSGTSSASQTGITVQVGNAGAGLPFSIQPPSLGLYYIIALTGIWPPRC